MKQCTSCGTEYPATPEYFCQSKQGRHGLLAQCRECTRTYQRTWAAANLDRLRPGRQRRYRELEQGISANTRAKRRHLDAPLRARAQVLRAGMYNRSKERGLPFDDQHLTVGYLMAWLRNQPTCECCHRQLDISFKQDGRPNDASPSIDRIIPATGYVVGNVALLCWRCNNIKRDATWEELHLLADWLKSRTVGDRQ